MLERAGARSSGLAYEVLILLRMVHDNEVEVQKRVALL